MVICAIWVSALSGADPEGVVLGGHARPHTGKGGGGTVILGLFV